MGTLTFLTSRLQPQVGPTEKWKNSQSCKQILC